MASPSGDIPGRVARTVKWNIVDRVSTQLLYALTGIVLARTLTQADFGIIGAVTVFQAFASLFVDSGFSSALLQRKRPDDADYSTVFWFNLAMAAALYAVLWVLAPWIATLFHAPDTGAFAALARVMFLSFILSACSIVQANRLMKRMDVKMIAVANSAGLAAGAVVGIWLALAGRGAWAIVWQTVVIAAVKGAVLWVHGRWLPRHGMSLRRLRSFFSVGAGVMATSLLNTVFQNIYSFFIGNRVGLTALGYFTQADKWSKMGVTSITQVLTSSFLPLLAEYQDNRGRFAAATAKVSRLTAWMTMPAMGMLAVMAPAVFHALFGTKWDASVPLFRLLLLRGVFTVMTATYTNFLLALGLARKLVWAEALRDAVALGAIAVTLPWIALSGPADPVEGLRIFLWGQVIAAAVACGATLLMTARHTARTPLAIISDVAPYAALALAAMAAMTAAARLCPGGPWLQLAVQGAVGAAVYLGANALLGSAVQRQALAALRK